MANKKHLNILKQGVQVWNKWRSENPFEYTPDRKKSVDQTPDLSNTDLSRKNLEGIDFSRTNLDKTNLAKANLQSSNLTGATLRVANLNYANLSETKFIKAHLTEASLFETDLSKANLQNTVFIGAFMVKVNLSEAFLKGAFLDNAYLLHANLSGANLIEAKLRGATLNHANLSKADLTNAIMRGATFVGTNLNHAKLINCHIFGVSAWKVNLKDAQQENLVISEKNEPLITVDNLEVAQFIYLLLHNETIRHVIDTITSKVVLILGRFNPDKGEVVLDAIRKELRKYDYLPVLFDFEKPANRDFTETIVTLAGLSKFIIADLSEPKSTPLESHAIVPNLSIPFVPIIKEGERPFSMFADLQRKHKKWVLNPISYKDKDDLINHFEAIIKQVEQRCEELIEEKGKKVLAPTPVHELK